MKYTLEQLEGMSDKQISEAVLSLITGYSIDEAREIISTGYFSKSSFCDYCNSWADMGPLISSALIDITYASDGSGYCRHEILIDLTESHFALGRELRAAAIVYILVKQEKL